MARVAPGSQAFSGFWARRPPIHTHPEPALALVGAVVHLNLAQGDGVDDPVDQLFANLLRGALQRQRPDARRGCRGLPGCAAGGRPVPLPAP